MCLKCLIFSLLLLSHSPHHPPCAPMRFAAEGELVPVSVKEGDKVLLPEYGGTAVKLADKE